VEFHLRIHAPNTVTRTRARAHITHLNNTLHAHLLPCTHTHIRTHAHTHAHLCIRAHTRTFMRTHTNTLAHTAGAFPSSAGAQAHMDSKGHRKMCTTHDTFTEEYARYYSSPDSPPPPPTPPHPPLRPTSGYNPRTLSATVRPRLPCLSCCELNPNHIIRVNPIT